MVSLIVTIFLFKRIPLLLKCLDKLHDCATISTVAIKQKRMLTKAEFNFIKSLQDRKVRNEHKLFVAEGSKIVNDLLGSKLNVYKLYALSSYTLPTNLSKNFTENIVNINNKDLERLSSLKNTRDCIAVFYMPEPINAQPNLTIVADNLQDPGNLGTIIRIADWFGITQIICSLQTVDAFNNKTVQATMGSIARVNLTYTDLTEYLSICNQPIYAAAMQGKDVNTFKAASNAILIIGNEGSGISNYLKPFITDFITIPKTGGAESLNAAVATGIIVNKLVYG